MLRFLRVATRTTQEIANEIIDITTEGGPAKATTLMVYKIYFDGFKGLDYSGAAAQSIVLMLLVIGLTFVQFRYVERKIHYK